MRWPNYASTSPTGEAATDISCNCLHVVAGFTQAFEASLPVTRAPKRIFAPHERRIQFPPRPFRTHSALKRVEHTPICQTLRAFSTCRTLVAFSMRALFCSMHAPRSRPRHSSAPSILPLAPHKAPFAKSVQSLGFVQIHSICLSV